MKKVLMMCVALCFAVSCNDPHDHETDGKQSDTIKLSTKEVNLTNDKLNAEITTEGDKWWISDIEVDGKVYALPPNGDNTDEQPPVEPPVELPVDFSIKYGIIEGFQNGFPTIVEIKGDWIIITRELQKITISATKNKTDKSRQIKICVQHANYYDNIVVKLN